MPSFQSPNVGPPTRFCVFCSGKGLHFCCWFRVFCHFWCVIGVFFLVLVVLVVWVRILWIPLSWNSTSLLMDRFWCPGGHPFCGVSPFFALAFLVGVFEFTLSEPTRSVPLLMEVFQLASLTIRSPISSNLKVFLLASLMIRRPTSSKGVESCASGDRSVFARTKGVTGPTTGESQGIIGLRDVSQSV